MCKTTENGVTPRFLTPKQGLTYIYIVLFENSTNVNEKWENSAIPLLQAARNGYVFQMTEKNNHVDVCKVLLEENVNFSKRWKNGETLFQIAKDIHFENATVNWKQRQC